MHYFIKQIPHFLYTIKTFYFYLLIIPNLYLFQLSRFLTMAISFL